MQIVRIPWAHIPVSVELDIPETEKLATVRDNETSNETNRQTKKQNLSSNTFVVDAECTEQSHFIFNNYEISLALMGLKEL